MTYSFVEQNIINAAQNIFLRYGFHGTRIQQIAVKAGVSKSTIHYYFRSKKKLYAVVTNYIIDDFLNSVTDLNTKEVIIRQQKWFLFTEMYNNQTLFEKSLKENYLNDWNTKLQEIKKLL